MPEFEADSSVKRIMKNGVFTALRFGVYALSGFLFIPFLVRQYGSGPYGLIALGGFLTPYIGLISGCVGGAVGRFLNVALNKNDWQQANEIFSTAIVANLLFVCIQVPILAFVVWKLDWIIAFPPERALDFRILVLCNIAVFLIGIFKGVLFVPIYASNRLDIDAKLDIFGQIFRLVILILLVTTVGPYLWFIGIVDLFISMATGTIGFKIYRKLVQNQLGFRWRHVSLKWVRPVMNMAGWGVVAAMGQALFQKTDVWIVNRFVSMELGGVCAALLIWPNFVLQISKNISSLVMPVYMIDYARGRIGRIRDASLFLSKAFAIMSLLVSGLVMLFGGWLLETWMDASYRQYHGFLILLLIHFPLTLSREAIWSVFPAFNKMHYLGWANLISGIMNIGLSLLAVYWGFGLAGVIVATGISLILQRTVFLSCFVSRLLEIRFSEFLKIYFPGAVVLIGLALQWIYFSNAYVAVVGMVSIAFGVVFGLRVVFRDATFKALMNSVIGMFTRA